ncbi:rod shape-determining protein RodA [Bacteroidia bacterium]|nr:rod shape-determining protein RodA [Bacteroidia bacterium]GHT87424.1 rod shape-determining protein RodA [Bacteroidia bacterium]
MLDWWTIALYLVLVIAGWFSIYAATYDYDQISMVDLSGRAGMQMVWILSSLLIGFSLLLIESDWYEVFAFWIYILIMLLLIVTIFIAPDIKGSRSWLVLGPVRIQPAEFAKFATALAVAKVMAGYRFEIMEFRNMMTLLGLIFLPMVLILLQQETGSALVFLAFFLVLYREGMPGAVLFSGFAAVLFFVVSVRFSAAMWHATPVGEFLVLGFIILFVTGLLYNYLKGRGNVKFIVYVTLGVCAVAAIVSVFAAFNWCWVLLLLIAFLIVYFLVLFIKYRASTYMWIIVFAICSVGFLYSVDYVFDEVLEPHQKIRIEVALGMVDDPSGAGYNVNQSKIAIGSGGITGKGYLNGTQTKLKYVPEQDTDFIFCTIGEEKGFIGSASVLILFLVLIVRLIYLAERQKSVFNRVYGYIVASILFFHLAINIGMVTGITPVIGIPLPFFSYGGSSLWAFTILLFIFLRLDASRSDRL